MKKYFVLVFVLFSLVQVVFASEKYSYVKEINSSKLTGEINSSTITIALDYINSIGTSVDIYMKASLTAGEENLLGEIVTAHTATVTADDPQNVYINYYAGQGPQMYIKGEAFTAVANSTTTHNFVVPSTASIQGGYFSGGNSNTGDRISLILLPDTAYETTYIDRFAITTGGDYLFDERFGASTLLNKNTPIRIKYENTGGTDLTICINIIYRIPQSVE